MNSFTILNNHLEIYLGYKFCLQKLWLHIIMLQCRWVKPATVEKNIQFVWASSQSYFFPNVFLEI